MSTKVESTHKPFQHYDCVVILKGSLARHYEGVLWVCAKNEYESYDKMKVDIIALEGNFTCETVNVEDLYRVELPRASATLLAQVETYTKKSEELERQNIELRRDLRMSKLINQASEEGMESLSHYAANQPITKEMLAYIQNEISENFHSMMRLDPLPTLAPMQTIKDSEILHFWLRQT